MLTPLLPPSQPHSPTLTTLSQIASAFGGALYIDLGRDGPRTESFELTVDGAVKAPYFVLGSTTNAEWQTLRNNPAPQVSQTTSLPLSPKCLTTLPLPLPLLQAELVSEHVAFSLRSNSVVGVDDMEALMQYWDSVVQYQDELGGFDAIRTYAYRINIDVQISVGIHAPRSHSPLPCPPDSLYLTPSLLGVAHCHRLPAFWLPNTRAFRHRR